MQADDVLKFAIVGHPNEGKSSVLSTLAEDDSVRISPTPGETVNCQQFPVIIDGREVIRFIDTPGFQNPRKILHQLEKLAETTSDVITVFRQKNKGNPEFKEDRELLRPISEGAGIIYVVDGSRPVRSVDRAEMEILRLTGLPRMAVINSKVAGTDFLDQWKDEFRKCFNIFRVFNAHTADYTQRIELLESLKNIDQDWQEALETVIEAFTSDWKRRSHTSAGIITEMLRECLAYTIVQTLSDPRRTGQLQQDMQQAYEKHIRNAELRAHRQIRALYKHNIFNYDLPPGSILLEDLFSETTWKFLGLTRNQQIAAAGLTGAGLAAAIDAVTFGASFGLFAALGGIAGASWAALGHKGLAGTRILGLPLGGHEVQIGPVKNIQFLYILLDRSLIYYAHISNWAHGRRNFDVTAKSRQKEQTGNGYAAGWDTAARGICSDFFKTVTRNNGSPDPKTERLMKDFIVEQLEKISRSQHIKPV